MTPSQRIKRLKKKLRKLEKKETKLNGELRKIGVAADKLKKQIDRAISIRGYA